MLHLAGFLADIQPLPPHLLTPFLSVQLLTDYKEKTADYKEKAVAVLEGENMESHINCVLLIYLAWYYPFLCSAQPFLKCGPDMIVNTHTHTPRKYLMV